MGGPQKHFKTGYVVSYVASTGVAVMAEVAAVEEGRGVVAKWQENKILRATLLATFSRYLRMSLGRHVQISSFPETSTDIHSC